MILAFPVLEYWWISP